MNTGPNTFTAPSTIDQMAHGANVTRVDRDKSGRVESVIQHKQTRTLDESETLVSLNLKAHEMLTQTQKVQTARAELIVATQALHAANQRVYAAQDAIADAMKKAEQLRKELWTSVSEDQTACREADKTRDAAATRAMLQNPSRPVIDGALAQAYAEGAPAPTGLFHQTVQAGQPGYVAPPEFTAEEERKNFELSLAQIQAHREKLKSPEATKETK